MAEFMTSPSISHRCSLRPQCRPSGHFRRGGKHICPLAPAGAI